MPCCLQKHLGRLAPPSSPSTYVDSEAIRPHCPVCLRPCRDELKNFGYNPSNSDKVFKPKLSDNSCPMHAIVLVGYNNDDSDPYWIARNSWGSDWGDRGYFKVMDSIESHDSAALITSP